jgi:hypothetical protein
VILVIQNDETKYHSALRTIITSDRVPQNFFEDITDANEIDDMFLDDNCDENDEEYHLIQIILKY